MSKIIITHEFDSPEDAARHLQGLSTTSSAAPVTQTTEQRAEPAATSDEVEEVETDSDGMPYDPEVHASTKGKSADGRWKAQRGKAADAKAARERFLASGGDVKTADTEKPAPAMPGLPGSESSKPVAPTYDEMVARVTQEVNDGNVTGEDLAAIYQKCGSTDAAAYQQDENLRVALLEELDDLVGE